MTGYDLTKIELQKLNFSPCRNPQYIISNPTDFGIYYIDAKTFNIELVTPQEEYFIDKASSLEQAKTICVQDCSLKYYSEKINAHYRKLYIEVVQTKTFEVKNKIIELTKE